VTGQAGIQVLKVDWAGRGTDLMAIRVRVFVDEQRVPPELELDGLDPIACHFLALDGGGTPVGCGRMLPDGHIGRMAVLEPFRRKGVGRALLAALVEEARSRGLNRVFLHAQVQAAPFYTAQGFQETKGTFLDAGIPHRYMYRYV